MFAVHMLYGQPRVNGARAIYCADDSHARPVEAVLAFGLLAKTRRIPLCADCAKTLVFVLQDGLERYADKRTAAYDA